MKLKWQGVLEEARALVAAADRAAAGGDGGGVCGQGSSGAKASSQLLRKPEVLQLSALLDTAASLPLPEQSPGGEKIYHHYHLPTH